METITSQVANLPQSVHRILGQGLDASISPRGDAVALPPECYTDDAFYEFEKDVIFFKEWLCVGRLEQIPQVGDYFTITLVDEPLIVVRSDNDEVRVMSAVCRHRGMVITAPPQIEEKDWQSGAPDTDGHCEQFRCPYHFWRYSLDGQLIGAPEMERTPGFRQVDVALPQFLVETWNGFIFMNFYQDAEPLSPRLQTLHDILENWHLNEMTDLSPMRLNGLPWNWKIMQENSIEAYHADRLHQGTHSVLPSGAVYPAIYDEKSACIIVRVKAERKDFSLNPMGKSLLPVIKTLTEEERETATYALIPPTLLLGTNADSAVYRIVIPTSAQSINIQYGTLTPRASQRPSPRYRAIRRVQAAGSKNLASQDFSANSAVQRGLRSRFASRGPYSWQEDSLPYFNDWLVARYKSGVAALR